MNDTRPIFPSVHDARHSDGIPESQSRALERRQALDEQQRAFRKHSATTPRLPQRPPS